MLNPNIPAWFEIPVADLDRAQAFYEGLLGTSLTRERFADDEMAVFPYAGKPNSSGALVAHPKMAPSMTGTTVYLSVESVSAVLDRMPGQGGEVLVPRTELHDGLGVFAQFRDCEGNRVGLWSQQ
ncbi:VOC family protein [Luteimonas soli]|uniref:VOC family protein n=1 Tax=Luteimonas soli TaxID=1648966 RepID=A0ABV7XLQ6_9GAMM